MRTRTVFLSSLALFCLTLYGAGGVGATIAQKPAFAGFRGLNINAQTDHTRPDFAVALGFRLSPQWRIEGEASGFRSETRTTQTGLVNLYYDADIGSDRVKPFIGVGVGLMDRRDLSDDNRALGLALHAGGGVRLMLNRNLSLSGDYRFINTLPLYSRGTYGEDTEQNHQIRFGLTYDIPPTRIIDPAFAR